MKRNPAGIFPSEDSLPGSLKNGRFRTDVKQNS